MFQTLIVNPIVIAVINIVYFGDVHDGELCLLASIQTLARDNQNINQLGTSKTIDNNAKQHQH